MRIARPIESKLFAISLTFLVLAIVWASKQGQRPAAASQNGAILAGTR
jgi:hypothetical protein